MTLYAIQSFNFSLQACKDLLKLRDQWDSTYPSLVIAIHGFYGRPFKVQRGVSTKEKMCIDPKVVPPKFSGMHKFLIDLRDKVLLHNDADELPAMGEPINRVRLSVTPSGREFHSAAHFFHSIETYQKVPRLLDVLRR